MVETSRDVAGNVRGRFGHAREVTGNVKTSRKVMGKAREYCEESGEGANGSAREVAGKAIEAPGNTARKVPGNTAKKVLGNTAREVPGNTAR